MRTFIAFNFTAMVHLQLQETCSDLRRHLAAFEAAKCLRWASMHNAHLTLRFLGETTKAQAQALAAELHSIAVDQPPFELSIGDIGGFPDLRQPRVLWLGVSGDLAQLNALQAAVERAMQRIGFAAEARPYSPHITLARAHRSAPKSQLRLIGQLVQEYALREGHEAESAETLRFRAEEAVHLQSELQRGGAVYTPLGRFQLGG